MKTGHLKVSECNSEITLGFYYSRHFLNPADTSAIQ